MNPPPVRLPQRPHILVRSTNWVGDVILTTPVYRALRRNYPEATITVSGRSWVADLLKGNPHIDHVITDEGKGLRAMERTARAVRHIGPVDLGIALPNSFASALLLLLAGARRRVGFATQNRRLLLTHPVALPPWLADEHQVEYYLHLIQDWCADLSDVRRLDLVVAPDDTAAAAEFLTRTGVPSGAALAAIAPGAAFGTAKRWPYERYAELAAHMVQHEGLRVVMVGSKGEGEVAGRITAAVMNMLPPALHSWLIDSCGQLTLRQTAALLQRCRVFITNDSGAMHLSAALDLPQVAIFGPTDPVTTPPYSRRALLVREPTECSPCLLRHCPIDHRCMTRVTVGRVIDAVHQQLHAQ